MKKHLAALGLMLLSLSTFAQDIKLPNPKTTGGKPFKDALMARQSSRSFLDKDLDQQTLSDLLWSAYGFNRADKRVAPSAKNSQEITLYVVLKSGVYIYDAKENKLIEKLKGDHRKIAGAQPYVQNAPLNLIYVSDLGLMPNKEIAFIDAGFPVQNVYLFCASEGNLGTVVRGLHNSEEIKKTLNLGEKQEVIIGQTIGYSK